MSAEPSLSRVLLVVSAAVASTPPHGPRKDYRVLADVLGAEVIDYASVHASGWARLVARWFGMPVAQAALAFRRRHQFDAILTDGEHIGIPLALLLKIARARIAHVTIGHRLTAAKKRPFFRLLRVHTHMARIAVHARAQYELAIRDLDIDAARLALIPYQVDTAFWTVQRVPEERLICSAGLEFRDYPTLMSAVDGLDVRVVIGAASHWSRRRNTAAGVQQPANVSVDAFDYQALRNLYARAALVVVPLDDTDFQAGITTILEAMAMGKPVVVTHSRGQTDVVEDRRATLRGREPKPRPSSMLRALAHQAGFGLEPSGFYVPPSDPQALRRAIVYLMDHPEERQRLGAAGRRTVERLTTVDQYAARIRDLIEAAVAACQSPAGTHARLLEPASALGGE